MTLQLEDNRMCYVCGEKNEHGFKLKFNTPEAGLLQAEVVFTERHQGFKQIVHGGIISMILDEMMVNLAWKEGFPAVTAELNVRLKKAAKVGERLCFEGRIDERKGRVLRASSKAVNPAGEVVATATATCLRIKP